MEEGDSKIVTLVSSSEDSSLRVPERADDIIQQLRDMADRIEQNEAGEDYIGAVFLLITPTSTGVYGWGETIQQQKDVYWFLGQAQQLIME